MLNAGPELPSAARPRLRLLPALLLVMAASALLGPPTAGALRCWECLEDSCHADSSYQNHAKRECPADFVCQKTIFRFFYKFNHKLPRKEWNLHRSVVRGCAARCKQVDERPYCDAMLPNLTHPDQDMGGCVERYCCARDLCNGSVSIIAFVTPTRTLLVAFIIILYNWFLTLAHE